jgi:hypothetical protein
MHSSSGLTAQASSVPTQCAVANVTSKRKVLEYRFELTSCISDELRP